MFVFVYFVNSHFTNFIEMPKVKRTRKPPPDGWELIEPTIDELDAKMREGLFEDSLLTSLLTV